ncbi:MAG: hypothetical protein LLF98_02330 [Clostridium sp.]|uniref:hypothetical protein n=1 Tax=Clostridium sp. TaxID=1506 RepID=UPI0025C3E513|nr:hypothetical protein [Clostridium sp.]MCE5220119.1 hypothetical protein [Clostridium sp.]
MNETMMESAMVNNNEKLAKTLNLKPITKQRSKDLNTIYKWISNNQNKSILLSVMAGSICFDVEMKNGYRINEGGGIDDIELIDNITENSYHIMLFSSDIKYTTDQSKMEFEADFQLETDEAIIIFMFV